MAADVVETADVLQRQADSLQDQVANFVLQLRSVNSNAGKRGPSGASGASGDDQETGPLNVARSA
jgi:hypothetical protein